MKLIFITVFAILATAESRAVRCMPKSLFFEYCNTCWCSATGIDIQCTNVVCSSGMWNKDGTLKSQLPKLESKLPELPRIQQICRPRETFRENCDECTCSDDGKTAMCSSMQGCDSGIWNADGTLKYGLRHGQVCVPDTAFNDQCNDCRCSADGKSAACTKMACIPRLWIKT